MIVTNSMIRACEYKDTLSPKEWASEYYFLEKESAVGAGRFSFSYAPHQALPLEVIGDDKVREVVIWVASQTGKTTLAMIALNWYMDSIGGNAMFFLPSDELVSFSATDRILPAINRTINKNLILEEKEERKLRDNTKNIRYLGGVIRVLSSSKSANRKSTPASFIILDEISEMKHSHVLEISERAKTFEKYGSKIIKTSTAMSENDPIVYAYEASEVKYEYFVKCPFCKKSHPDDFLANIRYKPMSEFESELKGVEKESIKTATYANLASKDAKYECPFCKKLWGEKEKDWAIDNGNWHCVSLKKQGRSVGFKASSFISKFVSLSELVRGFLIADDDEKKAAFYRGWLNQIYTPQIKERDLNELAKLEHTKLERGELPNDCVGLFGAIDVQKDCYYFLVMAVDSRLNRYIIDYGRFGSDVELIEFAVGARYFKKDDSTPFYPEVIGIDSGFRTDEIYQMCYNLNHYFLDYTPAKEVQLQSRAGELISAVALKGSSISHSGNNGGIGSMQVIDKDPTGRAIEGGVALHTINTYLFKDALMSQIQNQIQDKEGERLFIYKGADDGIYKSLVSEHKVQKEMKSGRVAFSYEPISKHPFNHFLDCCVYCNYLIARYNVRFRASAYVAASSQPSLAQPQKSGFVRDYLDEF